MRAPSHLFLLGLLTGSCIPGCGEQGPDPICAQAETSAVSALCALDGAVGAPSDGLSRCAAIEDAAWREGCVVQVADRQAWEGDLAGALSACLQAPSLTRTCLDQVAWSGVQGRVEATPESPDAQAQIDAHVEGLPRAGIVGALRGFRSAEKLARAAAWHGVYAGSGSTSPVALAGASPEDVEYARAAFAWEAVRLLPPELPVDEVLETVRAIATGAQEPVTGPPSSQACWTTASMPRLEEDFRYKPVRRAYGTWLRFTDRDPDVDLTIALYDAIVLHRKSLPSEYIFALKAHPSVAVQKTVSRYIALLAPAQCDRPDSDRYAGHCAEFGWVARDADGARRDVLRFVLNSTRNGLRDGLVPYTSAPGGCL